MHRFASRHAGLMAKPMLHRMASPMPWGRGESSCAIRVRRFRLQWTLRRKHLRAIRVVNRAKERNARRAGKRVRSTGGRGASGQVASSPSSREPRGLTLAARRKRAQAAMVAHRVAPV